MSDFMHHIFREVKEKRLDKTKALELIREFETLEGGGAFTAHPLLHKNTSRPGEQRYSSVFGGSEFFLADHRVRDDGVLPGVAYLEMARAAIGAADSRLREGKYGVRLHNVVWVQPLMINGGASTVDVVLHRDGDDRWRYEIHSRSSVAGDEGTMHGQGQIDIVELPPAAPRLDLAALQRQCTHADYVADHCYRLFNAMGIHYGASFQGLQHIHVGPDQVLAQLRLPAAAPRDGFALHPSLMDAALQAALGLYIDPARPQTPPALALPFALRALDVFGGTDAVCWAYVRRSGGCNAGDKVQRLDIDLCDGGGLVRVRLSGFTSRVLAESAQAEPATKPGQTLAAAVTTDVPGNHLLTAVWDAVAPSPADVWPAAGERVVLIGEDHDLQPLMAFYPEASRLWPATVEQLASQLSALGPVDHVIWRLPADEPDALDDEALIDHQQHGVMAGFRLTKALLQLGYGSRSLGWTVLTEQSHAIDRQDLLNPTHASVHGLVGSLAKEYPHWSIRSVDLPRAQQHQPAYEALLRLPAGDGAWVYRNRQWYRQSLAPYRDDPAVAADVPVYRQNGVYVVIGGAGGIGVGWSEQLIRQYQAQIVWIGRRPIDTEIQNHIDALAKLGPAPHYIAADAGDRAALDEARRVIQQRYGDIHGVVHSAIVLKDQSLAKMDEARFLASLGAKVDVSVRLAQVFGPHVRDFLLFFSSMQSFSKSAGQSNYAAGCTFKDAYALALAQHADRCAVKLINWGYWGSVGIVASDVYRARMAQAGVGSLEIADGMAALNTLLASPVDQLALMKTTQPGVLAGLNTRHDDVMTVYRPALPALTETLPEIVVAREEQRQTLYNTTLPVLRTIDRQVYRLLWRQLHAMGLFGNATFDAGDLKSRSPLLPLYHRWLDQSLVMLAEHGYLHHEGDGRYSVTDSAPPDSGELWQQWDEVKQPWLDDEQTQAQVKLVEATLRALPDILAGRTPATDIMFPNASMSLVEGVYKHNPISDYFNDVLADTLEAYLKARLQDDGAARLRILEIGAGTGGTSARVLRMLQPYQQHIADYSYTDLSKAFLMHARQHYGPANPFLSYHLFDISAPFEGQGIDGNHYDIVIAANVLHATPNIRQTVRHAKAALRPNGLLLLNELSGTALFTHLTFGLLEGWWLYEDPELRLAGSPALSGEGWRALLASEGYRSIDLPAPNATECGQQIIVAHSDGVVRLDSTALTAQAVASQAAETGRPELQSQLSADIETSAELIEARMRSVIRESIAEVLKMAEADIDNDRSFSDYGIDSIVGVNLVNQINSRCGLTLQTTVLFDYQTVERLAQHICEVHRPALETKMPDTVPVDGAGADAVLPQGPADSRRYAAASGQMAEDAVRAAVRESIAETLKMAEGDIEDDRSFADYGIDSIVGVNLVNLINERCGITLQTTVLFDFNHVDSLVKHVVDEYREALTPLLAGDAQPAVVNEFTPSPHDRPVDASTLRPAEHLAGPSGDGSTYYRVLIEGPGGIDRLKLVQSATAPLRSHEVRVAVRAFSLNFGDLLCVKGLYPTMPPYPFSPGFEISGVVVETGPAVTGFKAGDEVFASMGESLGGQASMVICPEQHVLKKPLSLSHEQACALPAVAITMIAAFEKARLKHGEKVLIQTATGGTGLIAVQLAKHYGAEIYATAGSQEKLDYLAELGITHLINYRQDDFASAVARMTANRGVDVVINTLPGDAMQKGLGCLAPGGRYIEIAMTALKSARAVDLSVLSSNQTFYSVDLRKLGFEDPAKVAEYQREMIRLVDAQVIQPTICRVFPLNEIKLAHQWLEARKNIGKIVVTIPAEYQYRLQPSVPAPEPTAALIAPRQTLQRQPIAIVGMSGRFAQSPTLDDLWTHLAAGDDLVSEVSRWDLSSAAAQQSASGGKFCRHGSLLDDIDRFDPLFFNISGVEATYMDPQQRIFLEQAWTALEDAGYAGSAIEGQRCGVYVGCSSGDYHELFDDEYPAQAFWGNTASVIPARISYYLNLQGPSVAIDTACSSSLVAVHSACQALWTGEIDMAIAGGVFVQATPKFYLFANRAEMLSPTGHCHTFDQQADGFVPGEGVGVVVLKALSQALEDGDHIHGVIRGSGINQDGASNGITAPSANSQERLLRQVYEQFDIDPGDIQMVEAHGTGTVLGDPIEFDALSRAFGKNTTGKDYCALGSIKTNVGHTASAAGVSGLLKILLSLKHGQIPASLHFDTVNPNIDFSESPFYVNTTLKAWTVEPGSVRRAALSSFGFSGTNAHMVIEEAPLAPQISSEQPAYLMVLSARTDEQLRQQVRQLLVHAEQADEFECGNVSYTLLLGRKHLNCRWACVARGRHELLERMRTWLDTGKALQVYVSPPWSQDKGQRLEPGLRRYGNQCISECTTALAPGDYLERLATVADLFVQGHKLEFGPLFAAGRYRKVPLPTYPFARERYWVTAGATVSSGDASQRSGQSRLVSPEDNPKPQKQAEVAAVSVVQHTAPSASVSIEVLRDKTAAYLKALVADTLQIPVDRIETAEPLEKYGIDSILVVKLTTALGEVLEKISSTLFFEYQTIDAVVNHLLETRKEGLMRLLGLNEQPAVDVAEPPEPEAVLADEHKPVVAAEAKHAPTPVSDRPVEVEPVAIVGLAGRYPLADDVDAFWENLKAGKNCITEIPADRWDWRLDFDEEIGKRGKIYTKWGGFIRDIDKFDPLFFQIAPRDAEYMDPQERLFLETAYAAIEDAGYTPENVCASRKVGVFAGIMNSTYGPQPSHWSVANRVSYVFNFFGPSLAVDTACSSSLTAIHLAVESLRSGSSDCAIAGGVNLIIDPVHYKRLSAMKMLSSGDQCKPFGDQADGFVDSEGVGAVVLKPLQRALEDGDHIYGVIRASTVNAGGKTNGYTVPNPVAQAQLVSDALRLAGVPADALGYLEAHGTGTSLGDPIEVNALTRAMAGSTGKKRFCAIGSVKSNIGHCESAAGIAGLTKVLMQMKHGQLAPSLHAQTLNPYIDFEDTPLVVQQTLAKWPRPLIEQNGQRVERPRLAGLSSFGAGGANAHLVVEEYWPAQSVESVVSPAASLVVLSAKNEQRLREVAHNLCRNLQSGELTPFHQLPNIAYTLQVGREAMNERLALVVDGIDALVAGLTAYVAGSPDVANCYRGTAQKGADLSDVPGDAPQGALETWIAEGLLAKAAQCWVNGADIDWAACYVAPRPQRISLPTYPFARKRYWLRHQFAAAPQTADAPAHAHASVRATPVVPEPAVPSATSIWDAPDMALAKRYEGDRVKLHTVDNTIALITMEARDDRNMFSEELVLGLQKRLLEVNGNEQIKVVILTGYDNVFCMGGTQDSLLEIADQRKRFTDLPFLYRGLLELNVPVISAVQGHAFGGGLLFGLYGDIVIMAQDGVFSANFMEYGFTPGMGATYILGEKLGKNLATEMMFTARTYTGRQLKDRGASVIVCAQDQVVKEAQRIALQLAKKPKRALTALKQELSGRVLKTLLAYIDAESKMHEKTFTGEEVVRQINAHFSRTSAENDRSKESPSASVAVPESLRPGAGQLLEINHEATFSVGDIRSELVAILGRVLHIVDSDIDDELTFQDMGADSIAGVEIVRDINSAFDLELEAAVLYEHCNIDSMARFVATAVGHGRKRSPETRIPVAPGADDGAPVEDVVNKAAPAVKAAMPEGVVAGQNHLQVKNVLLSILEHVLHVDRGDIDDEMSFQELGVDSIGGVEIIRDVNGAFGLGLDAAVLYEHPSVAALLGHIQSHCEGPQAPVPAMSLDERGVKPLVLKLKAATHAPAAEAEIGATKGGGKLSLKPLAGPAGAKPAAPASEPPGTDVAVIGMSCRFPGANNVEEFWRNLTEGRDTLSKADSGRWDLARDVAEAERSEFDRFVQRVGFIDDVDRFDPAFFNISPNEAAVMDPQQRLFLQEAWRALEDAGYSPKSLSECECGVFVGAGQGDYGTLHNQLSAHRLTGSAASMLAGRVAYFLDLSGPALAVDTACASSLSAIQLAYDSIVNGECEMALAGGVHVMTTPSVPMMISQIGILSSTGRSMTFDDAADGWVMSEGVGVLVLKPLRQAIEHGDPIYGVIKGVGSNQAGRGNGIGAPRASAQTRLQQRVYRNAGIDPASIEYVEVQGVSDKLGDAIEIGGLKETYSGSVGRGGCALGSLKPNIGHALTAAGVSCAIKVLLSLHHKQLVPTIHVRQVNPALKLDDSPFYINDTLRQWETRQPRRRAALNGFGFSGVNSHLVFEEYVDESAAGRQDDDDQGGPQLIVLSAKNITQLAGQVANLKRFVERHQRLLDSRLADVAYTLQVGRDALAQRAAFVVEDGADLLAQLNAYLETASDHRDEAPTSPVGDSDETIAAWLAQRRLPELKRAWVAGARLDWEVLHGGRRRQKMHLPTYAFAAQRCWLDAGQRNAASTLQAGWQDDALELDGNAAGGRVLAIVSRLLGRPLSASDCDVELRQLGMDSILFVQLLQQLRSTVSAQLSLETLRRCTTIDDIVLSMPAGCEPASPVAADTHAMPATLEKFPELVRLNDVDHGRPVIWFHAGVGGVEIYQPLAQAIERPFYGIQARGWQTERAPLEGIQAMAAYYVHIIVSLQPQGPYELGGYSLGGVLAYEVTRQLQELGQEVISMVMVDSPDSTVFNQANLSWKSEALQVINMALMATIGGQPERIPQTLVHRDELAADVSDEAFLDDLVELGRARGLKKTASQLTAAVEQNVRVKRAYEHGGFSVLPLPAPSQLSCHYLRNASGCFFGELEPYYMLGCDHVPFDEFEYWREWEREMPLLSVIDVDAPNHMMMLSDALSGEAIWAFCKRLYTSGEMRGAVARALRDDDETARESVA